MIFYLRFSLAFLLAGLIAAQAYGQFPRSGEKDAAPPSHKTGSITWKSDLPEALKLAREQRKLVFLHFSGTHCPPCRKLEDNVLNRNDVAITMLSRYVPVFIVVEQAQDLVERFHVQAWPTDVILDSEGREIARQVSPQNPQEFVKRLSMVAAKHHAGQSATIANVRAAVAADVTEAGAPVQQTAADDRPPAKSPRAESKIVHNPHAKEGRLPPIVARNTKPKVDVQEEEGFSPPNKRRKPPIVRKARETDEEAVVAKTDEPSIDEESTDTNVAPWRKTAQAKKPTEPKETAEPEQEVEADAAATDATDKQSNEPAPDEPAQDEPAEKVAELKPTEPTPEESEEKTEAKERTSEPEVTDELPAPRSRFGAVESTEKPVEVDVPAQESTEEVANQSGEETGDKSELPEEDEKPVEAETKKRNEEGQGSEAETAEPPRPKSRFSGKEESSSEPEVEESTATPAEKTVEQPEESQPEAVAEPEAKQKVAVTTDEAKTTDVVDESKTEDENNSQEQSAEKIDVADGIKTEFQKKYQETKPKEATKKNADKTEAPKKSKKSTEDPPQESAIAEEQPETEKSPRPRGLAKIARSGKYVLGGYCCVTLLESETLKKGNPQFGAIHRGRIFLFSSAEARKKFLENPDDYSPMLTGYDPVLFADSGELVEGSAEILAKLHDGRVVTFSSEETYKKFAVDYKKSREKSTYVEAVRAAMKETNGGRHFR